MPSHWQPSGRRGAEPTKRSNRSATSVVGTERTTCDARLESAIGGKTDFMCSEGVLRLLTHSRHGDLQRYFPSDWPRRLPDAEFGELHCGILILGTGIGHAPARVYNAVGRSRCRERACCADKV